MPTGITVYSDVIVPNNILTAGGVQGQSIRVNSRVPLGDTGYMAINAVWADTMRQYTMGIKPMSLTNWQAIQALFDVTKGGAFGMLMEDPVDHSCTTGVATLVSAGVYQLWKRYTNAVSSRTYDRKITRPRLAGFAITTSGTPITSYTLDVTTGQITIPSAPSASTLAWTGLFYVPVHFMEDSINWTLVAGGSSDQRLLAGPSVVLDEVRE